MYIKVNIKNFILFFTLFATFYLVFFNFPNEIKAAGECRVCTITSCILNGDRNGCISSGGCSYYSAGDSYNDTSENCYYRSSPGDDEYFCVEWDWVYQAPYREKIGEYCFEKCKTTTTCKYHPPACYWERGRYQCDSGGYTCTTSTKCKDVCNSRYEWIYPPPVKGDCIRRDVREGSGTAGDCAVATWGGGNKICPDSGNPPPIGTCSCDTQASCTAPNCTLGEIDFDTGDGAGTDTTCSYETGSCVGSTSQCATANSTKQCWIEDNDQPEGDSPTGGVTLGTSNNTTELGCTSIIATGQEVNNPLPVSLKYSDADGVDEIEALFVWFDTDGTPVEIETVSPSVTDPKLRNNGEFGLMFRRLSENDWSSTDIYISDYNGGTWRWVRRGSIGAGTRARLDGKTGKSMLFVNDVTVTKSASDVTIDFNIEFLNEESGVIDYEKAVAGTYNVYSMGLDWLGFLPYEDDNIRFTDLWTDSNVNWIVDLTTPVSEEFAYTIETAESISLDWEFSDTSDIARVIGNAKVNVDGLTSDSIDDETSGVLNYDLSNSLVEDSTFYDNSSHLWSIDNTTSRSEIINIKDNEGGSLEFNSRAFDSACNTVSTSTTLSLDTAWVTTKAGLLFSEGGTNLSIPEFSELGGLSDDSYWTNDRYGFNKEEVDLSTEFLSGGTDSLNQLIYDIKLSSLRASNYYDRNNKQEYWYDFFNERFESKLAEASEGEFKELTFDGDKILLTGTTVTDLDSDCTDSLCVINVAGNMTIENDFTCDSKAVFLVDGNIHINPDVKNADLSSGCFYMAGGSMYVEAGTHKSSGSTYPKYDVIEGFFLVDGQIVLGEVDLGETVRDGLKVNGSLLAFDSSTNRSIVLARSLKLNDNLNFPVLATHYDIRYMRLAPLFFGGERETFKQEVGFKPL